jgi:hypothetical protein
MLTIFSTPKPFRGHIGVIQRNAIQSWKSMRPAPEIILFGDEEGAAETCRELEIRHEPRVRRSDSGAKFLGSIFADAEKLASNDVLCYINCDIILPRAFFEATAQAACLGKPFLMVGQRWDTEITEAIDFSQPDWEERAVELARAKGKPMGSWFADYFVFSRGLYHSFPPFVIGRWYWDPWIVWKARTTRGAIVVDATHSVVAIHQNHDYSYHPDGFAGVEHDEEATRNRRLTLDGRLAYSRYFATWRTAPKGLRRHWMGITPVPQLRYFVPRIVRLIRRNYLWFPFLAVTRPMRRWFGIDGAWTVRLKNRIRSLGLRKGATTSVN